MMTNYLHSFCALIWFSVLGKVHITVVLILAISYVAINIRRCFSIRYTKALTFFIKNLSLFYGLILLTR